MDDAIYCTAHINTNTEAAEKQSFYYDVFHPPKYPTYRKAKRAGLCDDCAYALYCTAKNRSNRYRFIRARQVETGSSFHEAVSYVNVAMACCRHTVPRLPELAVP